MEIFRRSVISSVLLFALPLACFAQDRAILYPGDGSTINGKPTPITATVLSGDKLQTSKAGAQIVQAGSTVQLDTDTALQYGAPLQLGCGAVVVDGPASVDANSTLMVPSGRASYQVVNRGGTLLVTVKSGMVAIGDEKVSAGQAISRPGTSGCSATSAAPAVAAKGHGKLIGIVAAGAGAGVAGAVLAGRGDSGPVSPSRP